MGEGDTTSPSTRRKLDSMVRDIESIARLLQQASLEKVQLDVIKIENRIDAMEEHLCSPSVSVNA
tara:strand:+ start:130 stop:324 length:195 start_codon:yes stop_codon:yes gene_type:complete